MGRPVRHAGGDRPLNLRLATPGDIPVLPDIERSAGQAFRGGEQDWIADDQVTPAEAYPALVAAERVWVGEVDGAVRGFVQIEVLDHDLHIWELAVALDWQKRGLGRTLMAQALDIGRRRGCAAATLTTFRNIAWNAPFYRGLGFEILEAPSARLAAILASEAGRGLTDRCAMASKL
ncbi:GNAT family N-acetyltransferase [Phenylobacterium aquaticum]|uniref:GNAT family N-acetyltransferase n=1 Tax=Phenylobacterium aquaticum TaxID=1763816 RepID=UPI001F5CB0A7|nr:GNAT family N-acetyltransferase [Phenylobacterium aquaticum]MCI3133087.1 GNAT family N-acetyltransferase [Phenylobacterium aquaticum]